MAAKKTRRLNRRAGRPFNNESEYFMGVTVELQERGYEAVARSSFGKG